MRSGIFVAFQFYNTLQKSVYGTTIGGIHSMVHLLYRQKYGFILEHVGKRENSVMLHIKGCIYSFQNEQILHDTSNFL